MDISDAATQLFKDIRQALTDLESALIGGLDNEIHEGRLTLRRGDVAAELQWPYHGCHAGSKADKLPLRIYVEAALPPHDTTSPSITSSEVTDSRGITYDSGPSNDPLDDGWG